MDDNEQDLERISVLVEDLGQKPFAVSSLKAADRLLKSKHFDLCILDCFQDEAGHFGEKLIPQIRSQFEFMPIVMISNSRDKNLPDRVLKAGADIFVPKILEHLTFMRVIESASIQAKSSRNIKLVEYSYSKKIGGLYFLKN